MNFEQSVDLRAFMAALQRITGDQVAASKLDGTRCDYGLSLDRQLVQGGYFDCAGMTDLGNIAATQMVIEVSRVPACVELVASTMLAPRLCPDLPRPYAVMWEGLDRPTRFLPVARTVIALRDGRLMAAPIDASQVDPLESVFAYPVGRLKPSAGASLAWQPTTVDLDSARNLWRVGIAAEIVGCLSAGLASVVEHVKQRRQFGRPLGAFQGIQHRLAECATLVEGARWLVLKAADGLGTTGTPGMTDTPDTSPSVAAATALAQAQSITSRVTYDLHQFMGAMGLTLEHPLHRWTYRARMLRSELGGADRQFADLARAAWGH